MDILSAIGVLQAAGLTDEELGKWLANAAKNRLSNTKGFADEETASGLVLCAFLWDKSAEGIEYWAAVYDRLEKKARIVPETT